MKQIALEVDLEIFIRPLGIQEVVRTTSRVLGARHGSFIIIEECFARTGGFDVLPVEGDVLCWYINDGDVYRFQSEVMGALGEGMTLLKYPDRFQVQSLRKTPRIQVNIEVVVSVGSVESAITGTIQDISEGGCSIYFPRIVGVSQGTECVAGFELPDGQTIEGVKSVIRKAQHSKSGRATRVGIQFLGPPEALSRISSFCQFCMYFKV